MNFTIRQAAVSDIEALASLFDAYRQFYGQPADLARAREFLTERFRYGQSVAFIAIDDEGKAIGFTQLYQSFSSVSAATVFILNDLFVDSRSRAKGVGSALIDAAAVFARAVGALRLSLETAATNLQAQALYEKKGWERCTDYYVYNLSVQA